MAIGYKAALTLLVTAMAVSNGWAEEISGKTVNKPVTARLIILPGDATATVIAELDTVPTNVNLSDAAIDGSSSRQGQNSRIEILDDTSLGKAAFGTAAIKKARPAARKRPVIVKSRIKKSRSRIAKISSRRQILKRRASFMIGVYR